MTTPTFCNELAWMMWKARDHVEWVFNCCWRIILPLNQKKFFMGFGLETRYSAVASPIRSARTLRLPATTANATGLPTQPTPCTHTKRASDFCSPFQGYLD
ncbi:hypothetical protein TNCV_1037871 [Trichonephila clavipes]|nr:hypothetical protein TNCV_1037871 [Trichonephila clavipes]